MLDEKYFVIGVMSGTSLDGVDVVYVEFRKKDFSKYEIVFSETISYSVDWVERLREGISLTRDALLVLDIEYAELLSNLINDFIYRNNIKNVDFIASHGHTIFHQPDKGITLQIGDGQTIANKTSKKVVCDFRTQDVAFGGQGAPLVPIGDKILFSKFKYCINLGGFANISFDNAIGKRIAFDLCPLNIVLNHYARKLGRDFDDGGRIAMKGKLNEDLFEKLNSIDYYHQKPPKSLGLEWVQKNIFSLLNEFNDDTPTILRTFVEHAAFQIYKSIGNEVSVLYTGGGVFNTFLTSRIDFFSKQRVVLMEKKLIEYKEALIFALLGVLRVENKINCLASVTGANFDHSSGKIYTKKPS